MKLILDKKETKKENRNRDDPEDIKEPASERSDKTTRITRSTLSKRTMGSVGVLDLEAARDGAILELARLLDLEILQEDERSDEYMTESQE